MDLGTKMSADRRKEILGVFAIALTLFIFLALVTDGYGGEVRRSIDDVSETWNSMGPPGAWLAWFLTTLFGHGAHATYCITCVWGIMLLRHASIDRPLTRIAGFLLVTGMVSALVHIHYVQVAGPDAVGPQGAIGAFLGGILFKFFRTVGSTVVASTLVVVGILLATDFLFLRALNFLRKTAALMLHAVAHAIETFRQSRGGAAPDEDEEEAEVPRASAHKEKKAAKKEKKESRAEAFSKRGKPKIRIRPEEDELAPELPFDDVPVVESDAEESPEDELAEMAADTETAEAEAEDDAASKEDEPGQQELDLATAEEKPPVNLPKQKKPRLPRRRVEPQDELPEDYVYPKRYKKPSIDLFVPAPPCATSNLGDKLLETSSLLEETLQTFGIEARVTDVTRGPTITRFELEPAPGIKVSRFIALADDLALALKAHRVRVEAPIPGKGRVGIEVPNKEREPVVVRELFESRAFSRGKGQLKLALGKGIGGNVDVADLASMPHLLVAGATGAGKTVCVKTLLASLLFTRTPDEMQLMLIDPKMVELSIFDDIPHLITPVVTDPKKAASALNWLITEMEERYRLFAHLRTRNIEVYNESVSNGEIEMPDDEDGEDGGSVDVIRKLPYIVCVIDELADLMMLARSEVEDAIARLAQLARAVGIHLIIATQRPSVDVLTGVIKANFPSRLSFQVSSRVDSRCILDEIGAEKLIGKGDMLYLPAGQSKPSRIQGAFVSDDEMNRLIAYLKTQAPPQYRDEIEKFGKSKDGIADMSDEDDELFDDAVRVVIETGQASISMVQRRLRVGYTRAARLIDMMEMRGIVGPHLGSKAREILVALPSNDEVA